MIDGHPWRYRERERFGNLYNVLVAWRALVLLVGCGVPSAVYLWMERVLYREALAGRAMELREPQGGLVLGVAACAALGLLAAGVLYLLVCEPRAGLVAVLMHDGLQIVLLAGAVAMLRPELHWLTEPARANLGACAILTGVFAAEAVVVSGWRRWRLCAVACTLAYVGTAGLLVAG